MQDDDEISEKLLKEASGKIELFASEYIDKFNKDSDNCESIYDYYSLIISVIVFKNLSISQLLRKLEKLNTEESNDKSDDIIEIFEKIADDISSKVTAIILYEKTSLSPKLVSMYSTSSLE